MADKTKTIKNATDKELDDLINRLRKESQLQNLIADIKRRTNSGYTSYEYEQEVSTEKPIESMYHFGVPGMHWGRRKARGSITSKAKTTKSTEDSEDNIKKNTLRKKTIRELSNTELKTLNERFQLEKQYKDLSKVETSAGKKYVMAILQTAAKQTATTYVNKYMNKAVEGIINKASR